MAPTAVSDSRARLSKSIATHGSHTLMIFDDLSTGVTHECCGRDARTTDPAASNT